jgi:hypothetical protein
MKLFGLDELEQGLKKNCCCGEGQASHDRDLSASSHLLQSLRGLPNFKEYRTDAEIPALWAF